MPATPGAMDGVRIIEIAGEEIAFAGKLFADMGADVILVEPRGGTIQRTYEPFAGDTPDPEQSLSFWHYNTSKRGITVDLDLPGGQDLFKKLIGSADILLESTPVGLLTSLGLNYPVLKAINPGLIMVSMKPFGSSGPRAEEIATDLTILAGGGPAWNNGYDDHTFPPVRGGGNQGYQTGCHFAVTSALVALLHRDISGAGQFIDVNMHAAANVTTEGASYTWLITGQEVQRQTGRHAGVGPSMQSQIQCSDGRWVNTGIPPRKPGEFGKLYDWMEEVGIVEEFLPAPLLKVGEERPNIDLFKIAEDEEIAAIFGAGRDAVNFLASRLPAYEFFIGAQERGFQVGIIYSPEEVMEDKHFQDRGFPVEVEHPELDRTITYPGAPYLFNGSPWRISRRAPQLGEHNTEVLGEIGLSEGDIATLRETEVI